ncbi:MAG TPA: TlpA disulfide reductase family protein [Bacteroidia bacterium]|nr:TlpA disulfide reductase family protein [Bacteroidia bacterium]
MKNIRSSITSLMMILCITACSNSQASNKEKSGTGFIIIGNIAGLNNSDVYFMHKENDVRVTDTVKVRNNKFTYSGKADEPLMYYLDFVRDEKRERIEVFVENTNIQITGKIDSLDWLKISGSKVHNEYEQYKKSLSSFTTKLDSISELYDKKAEAKDEKAMTDLDNSYENMQKQMNIAVKKYISEHPSSYVSAFAAVTNFTVQPELEELKSVFTLLDSVRQQTQYGKVLRDAIVAAQRTAIGAIAPDFSMKDTSDQLITLSSFKGSVTLLDFWAAWCGPCRKENPNIVKAYGKFHEKGLKIFAVSLDKDSSKWKKAIIKDNLTWIHVSDLKYWSNDAASLYGVRSIPANFLLDKEGKIIARNLHGEDLEKKLAEIFDK